MLKFETLSSNNQKIPLNIKVIDKYQKIYFKKMNKTYVFRFVE